MYACTYTWPQPLLQISLRTSAVRRAQYQAVPRELRLHTWGNMLPIPPAGHGIVCKTCPPEVCTRYYNVMREVYTCNIDVCKTLLYLRHVMPLCFTYLNLYPPSAAGLLPAVRGQLQHVLFCSTGMVLFAGRWIIFLMLVGAAAGGTHM